jgi:hypothetical protein
MAGWLDDVSVLLFFAWRDEGLTETWDELNIRSFGKT